jgi:oligopeptide/dipeptide ABC transporter ATP-binding protein
MHAAVAPLNDQRPTADRTALLSIRDLVVRFRTDEGSVHAVNGVDLEVLPGRTLGVVGESGCGKSVTALAAMRLIDPPGEIVQGTIRLGGTDLLSLNEKEMQTIRGSRVSMIFQDPMTSLNPLQTSGRQIADAILLHTPIDRAAAAERAVQMLANVGIADPRRRAGEYPHELSGGMRQRVMIAMALATDPELLIADEPTTALDVTIQAQILELLAGLRKERGMALMLITHDLGVIARMADDDVVMYAGQVVERGPVKTIFAAPHHPYTRALLASTPRLSERRPRLEVIEGMVPHLTDLPTGCLFRDRCRFAMDICEATPPMRQVSERHDSRCWLTPAGDPPPQADVGELR